MRPLFWVGLGALCGAALSHAGLWAVFLLMAAVPALLWFRQRVLLLLLPSCALFCLYATLILPPDVDRRFLFKAVTVTGRVVSRAPYCGGVDGFVVDGSLPDGTPVRVRFFRPRSAVLLPCGTVLRVHGLLVPVRKGTSSWRRGVRATISSPAVEVVGFEAGVLDWVRNIRGEVCEQVVGAVPCRAGPFMRALIFGQRTALPQNLHRTLALTGTSHFLAISGIHLAMLVALSFWLLRRFILLRARVLVTIILCLVYLFISGAPVTLLRSLTVALVLLCGLLLGRRGDLLNTVGAALLFVLALDPFQVTGPAFQLSFITFTAVAATIPIFHRIFLQKHYLIIALKGYPPGYEPPLETIRRRIHEVLFFSAVASLATLPLLAYHFGTIPLVAVPANAILFPLFYLSLAGGFLTLFLFPFGLARFGGTLFEWLSRPIFWLGDGLKSLGLLLRIPSTHLPFFPIPAVCLFYLALFVTIARLRGRLLRMRYHHLLPFWGAAALAWFLWPHLLPSRPPHVRFIGAGSSYTILIKTPDGLNLLYDLRCRDERELHRLISELWAHGVDRLDAFIWPGDRPPDRIILDRLLRRIPAGAVLYPACVDEDPWTNILRRICARNGVTTSIIDANDMIGSFVRVIGPPVSLFGQKVGRGGRSMLLHVDVGDGVLVGDPSGEVSVALALLEKPLHAHCAFLTRKPCALFESLARKIGLQKAFFPRRPYQIPTVSVLSALVDEALYP